VKEAQVAILKVPTSVHKQLKRFDAEWGRFELLCIRKGQTIIWSRYNPAAGIG
jgi:hypothetical protein